MIFAILEWQVTVAAVIHFSTLREVKMGGRMVKKDGGTDGGKEFLPKWHPASAALRLDDWGWPGGNFLGDMQVTVLAKYTNQE